MKLSNCTLHPEVTWAAFRQPGCVIRGTDFDQFPGKGISFSGLRREDNIYKHRMGTGMEIRNRFPDCRQGFGFDSKWKRFVLVLGEKEFACYSLFDIKEGSGIRIHLFANADAEVVVFEGDRELGSCKLKAGDERQEIGPFSLTQAPESTLRIETVCGEVEIEDIITM